VAHRRFFRLGLVVVSLAFAGEALAERTPAIYGHRGASAEAPANSLRAFRVARARGADGVELDVRRARTGEIVVVHDPRVTLPSGKTAKVSHTDYATLRALGIPTLDEAIGVLGPRMKVNIEIKAETPFTRGLEREVVKIVRRHGIGERVLVSSFNPIALHRVKRLAPELRLGLLFQGTRALDRLASFAGASTVNPHEKLVDAESVARWHRHGYPIYTWTVDDPARIRELTKLGVDAIITNDPAKAKRAARGGN
jgi:glycerophosphoryl diester phosphodiesterase